MIDPDWTKISWQPIETAPRDGTTVLIFVPGAERRRVREAWWARPYEAAPDDRCWWAAPSTPGGNPRDGMTLPEHATHWAPMPLPPA